MPSCTIFFFFLTLVLQISGGVHMPTARWGPAWPSVGPGRCNGELLGQSLGAAPRCQHQGLEFLCKNHPCCLFLSATMLEDGHARLFCS